MDREMHGVCDERRPITSTWDVVSVLFRFCILIKSQAFHHFLLIVGKISCNFAVVCHVRTVSVALSPAFGCSKRFFRRAEGASSESCLDGIKTPPIKSWAKWWPGAGQHLDPTRSAPVFRLCLVWPTLCTCTSTTLAWPTTGTEPATAALGVQ